LTGGVIVRFYCYIIICTLAAVAVSSLCGREMR